MRFSNIFFLLPAVALASPSHESQQSVESYHTFETRSYSAVRSDLSGHVLGNITALNRELNGLDPKLAPNGSQSYNLLIDAGNLVTSLNKTQNDTDASQRFSKANSKKLFKFLADDLYPATHGVLNNFIKHYNFNMSGLAGFVEGQLVQQKAITQKLSASLTAKSRGIKRADSRALTKKFVAAFDAAIAKYSS